MRVLTDDPASAGAFFTGPRTVAWEDGELPPEDRRLIDTFGLARVAGGEAAGRGFWSRIILLAHTERSQFDALESLLGGGWRLPGPVASLALSGRRFRGQRQRTWAGVPGNLHLSVALPASTSAEWVGAGFSMLPAVAAVEAIDDASQGVFRPGIKWVNDLVVGERKLGGVLTTAHSTGRRMDDVIWGFGINVAIAPEIQPTPFVPATTCLHASPDGQHVTLAKLFWAVLGAVERRYAQLISCGPSDLFAAYRRRSVIVGRFVTVWDEADCGDGNPARWGPPLAEGIVTDIEPDLRIRLEGRRDPVGKGRLALAPLRPPPVGDTT